jgi:outer membrane protease
LSTNKANHEESTFNMLYVVVDIDLNVNRWLAAEPQLEAIFLAGHRRYL